MKKLNACIFIAAAVTPFLGCATNHSATDPEANAQTGISLSQAMSETIDATLAGMERLREESKINRGKHIGLALSEVEVTFNVTITKAEGNTFNLTVAPSSPVSIGGAMTKNDTKTNNNTIRFKFSNLLFADTNTVIGQTTAPVVITNGKKDYVLVTAKGPQHFVSNTDTAATSVLRGTKTDASANEQYVYQYMTFEELWAIINGCQPDQTNPAPENPQQEKEKPPTSAK